MVIDDDEWCAGLGHFVLISQTLLMCRLTLPVGWIYN